MMTERLDCDCGCGASAVEDSDKTGWIFVYQPSKKEDSLDPKLERNFHFKSISCLTKWAQGANLIANSLSKHARNGPRPRGTYHDKNLPGIYV